MDSAFIFALAVVCLIVGFWIGWTERGFDEDLRTRLDKLFPETEES